MIPMFAFQSFLCATVSVVIPAVTVTTQMPILGHFLRLQMLGTL